MQSDSSSIFGKPGYYYFIISKREGISTEFDEFQYELTAEVCNMISKFYFQRNWYNSYYWMDLFETICAECATSVVVQLPNVGQKDELPFNQPARDVLTILSAGKIWTSFEVTWASISCLDASITSLIQALKSYTYDYKISQKRYKVRLHYRISKWCLQLPLAHRISSSWSPLSYRICYKRYVQSICKGSFHYITTWSDIEAPHSMLYDNLSRNCSICFMMSKLLLLLNWRLKFQGLSRIKHART